MRRDDSDATTAPRGAPKLDHLGSVARFVSTGWDRLSKTPPLPEYALHYYDALKAKFETLPEPPASDAHAQKAYRDARAVVDMDRALLTWADLMLLDLSIVRSLGFDALRLKIVDLRARLDGSLLPLPEGLVPKLDAAKPGDIEALRAEAEVLATRVWHARMARNARDRYVGELRRTLFQWLLGIVTAFLMLSLALEAVPLYFVILTAGMLGALVSVLRRLQAALGSPPSPDQSSDLSALAYEKRAAVMSLFAGAVFAIVLYVAFVAGLSKLSGELAPEFAHPKTFPEGGADFLIFVLKIGPATGIDYAKVVVWSFIAGFFEQLVPDVLDRVVKKK